MFDTFTISTTYVLNAITSYRYTTLFWFVSLVCVLLDIQIESLLEKDSFLLINCCLF